MVAIVLTFGKKKKIALDDKFHEHFHAGYAAKVIYYAKRGSGWAPKRLDGLDKHGKPSKFKERYKKHKFTIGALFDTSQLCCGVMKKGPAKTYEKETGRKPARHDGRI